MEIGKAYCQLKFRAVEVNKSSFTSENLHVYEIKFVQFLSNMFSSLEVF